MDAADRVAQLVIAAGIGPDDVVNVRVRRRDDDHEWIVDTRSGEAIVVGRTPIVDHAIAYGTISDEYLRELAGRVRLRRGRRPGLTSIPGDDALRAALADMDRVATRVTRATLAVQAGYTIDEMRGYLASTNRSFADLLRDLRRPH